MQQQVPTLLFPPPPPPPLTPYYSSSLSSSSPASASSHHVSLSITSLPILLLTVLGILTTSILLLVYYIFVIRCCLAWHADSSDVSRSRRRRPGGGAISGDDGLPVARGAPGLEEPAIRALPAFRYRKAVKNDAAVESGECAVCLGEFQEEERVRLLPSCLHVFHVGCIDTWLHTNANCPLCRAAITTTTTSQLPLMDQLLRPREVVIQVQAVGTEEEGNMAAAGSEGDVAFLQTNMSAAREMRALQRG